MSDWWKAPILQGPENDYGQYDYMIEKLPKDYAKWEVTPYKRRCNSCGKESYVCFCSVHHFYTMDGWDSIDYEDCWRCVLKGKLFSIKHKFKKRFEALKITYDLCKTSNERYSVNNVKQYYNLALKLCK